MNNHPSITGVFSSCSERTILAQRYFVLFGLHTPFKQRLFLSISCISGAVITIILILQFGLEDNETFVHLSQQIIAALRRGCLHGEICSAH